MPKKPTIIKKQKFIMLTAVPDTIFLFVRCRTGTNKDVRLALPARIKNIRAMYPVLILNIKHKHIINRLTNVITEAFFKNITLWLWQIIKKDALIILKIAAMTAIIDKTIEAFEGTIIQKSSKNFLPIMD